MISDYGRFNEKVEDIREGSRVISHGTLRYWNDEGEYHIDIEGQTGIVDSVKFGGHKMCGVIFDNYFVPSLTSLDGGLKIRRGLWVSMDKLEKVPPPAKSMTREMRFSTNAKNVLQYVEYIKYPIYTDINYIDVTDKSDTISYIPVDRLPRLGFDDDEYKTPLRQEMKIGRFIQMINPNTNQVSLAKKVDMYKATYNGIIANKYKFEMIDGDDIIKWYDERNYQEGTGSLNQSCMRNRLDKLYIYGNDPKISMLIMVNEDGKLMGRALVWKVDEPNIIYMDRTYVVFQEDIYRFEDYAKKYGWKIWENYKWMRMLIYMNQNYGSPDKNPYMDTFKIFYRRGPSGENYLINEYEGGERDLNYYEYDEL